MIETILNIIFSPEFILLGTLFRTTPISGTNSGKLKFSNIISNANLIIDAKGITISTFFNQAINNQQIAFGCFSPSQTKGATAVPTGITSSKFFKTDSITSQIPFAPSRQDFLYGSGIISGFVSYSPAPGINICGFRWQGDTENTNSGIYKHSIILGGKFNTIGLASDGASASFIDVIVGGCGQRLLNDSSGSWSTFSNYNVLIDGKNSCLDCGKGNIIIGSGKIKTGDFNTIINSNLNVECSCFNSIFVSSMTDNANNPQFYCAMVRAKYSSLVSSKNSTIGANSLGKFHYNSIISSEYSCMYSDSGKDVTLRNNTIISSFGSRIFGGCSSDETVPTQTSNYNSVVSTGTSCIMNSSYSSILGGQQNIISYISNSGSLSNCQLLSSSIIGGYGNKITISAGAPETISRPSTIIGGANNTIYLSGNLGNENSLGDGTNFRGGMVIIGGRENKSSSSDGVTIASYKTKNYYQNNAIISSFKSELIDSWSSAMISSRCSCSWGKCYHVDISTLDHTPTQPSFLSVRISTTNAQFCENTCSNSIISSTGSFISCSKITNPGFTSKYSTVIASEETHIECGFFSSIINNKGSFLRDSSYSTIISGVRNKIISSTSSGIISSSASYVIQSINSFIIAGCNNILGTNSRYTCNSVILGGSNMTLTFSDTVMAKHFNFSNAFIFKNSTQYCNTIIGTFSNCFYCSLKIINGFIVS